jgi:hypothetical protein
MLDHALEHLGGGDHRLAGGVAFADNPLLDQRNLLRAHLDTEVAAGHHDSVAGFENSVEIGHRFGFFDLGNNA